MEVLCADPLICRERGKLCHREDKRAVFVKNGSPMFMELSTIVASDHESVAHLNKDVCLSMLGKV